MKVKGKILKSERGKYKHKIKGNYQTKKRKRKRKEQRKNIESTGRQGLKWQ